MENTLPFERIPPSESPLSADVIIIKYPQITYIFDVGESDEAYNAINSIEGNKAVIISHFHRDHSFNLSRLDIKTIYGSKETLRHTKRGNLVKDVIKLEDDLFIIPLPSSHCKGCLALLYKDYLFVGDALYPGGKMNEETFNPQILDDTIKTLEELDFKYFGISHRKMFVNPKEVIMAWLKYTRSHVK